jgi:hypothetical protein
MPSLDTAVIVLAGIVLFAAFVNGAIGNGFSSLTVPVALVFYSNRILNPAVVVIEVLLRALPEKIESDGIPLRARIGFKNRTGRQASMRWGSRIQRICVSG